MWKTNPISEGINAYLHVNSLGRIRAIKVKTESHICVKNQKYTNY
jgi:hypothetical protein